MSSSYDIYYSDFLSLNERLFPKSHLDRIRNIDRYEMIYYNDKEELYNYYTNQIRACDIYKESTFNKMMIINNYCNRATISLVDLITSKRPVFVSNTKSNTKKINKYIDENDFIKVINEIIIKIDVTGDCFCRVIENDEGEKDIQIFNTQQCFILKDEYTNRIKGYAVISHIGQEKGNDVYEILVSTKKKDYFYKVTTVGELISEVRLLNERNVNDFSVIHFNVYNGKSGYGISTYKAMETIQSNAINRINQLSRIQDKFSSPLMVGPELDIVNNEGEDDEEMQQDYIRKIETGTYLATDDANNVKYLQWTAPMTETRSYIQDLEDSIVSASRMETIVTDRKTRSQVTSSKALKMLYLNAIQKSDNYVNNMKGGLIKILKRILNLKDDVIINITFNNGVPEFEDETIENVILKLENNLISHTDAIAKLDGITIEEAKRKYEEIKKEKEENAINNTDDDNSSKTVIDTVDDDMTTYEKIDN